MKLYYYIFFCVTLTLVCMEAPPSGSDPTQEIYKSLSTDINNAITDKKDLNEPLSPHVPSNGNPPIIKAAQFGYTDLVEKLIEHSVNVNTQRGMGFASLHFTADQNNRPLLKLLLKHKANTELKSPDPWSYTPLHFAVERGHFGCIMDLLGAGADPNAVANNDIRPIALALKVCGDTTDTRTDQARKNALYSLLFFGAQPVDLSSELVVTSYGHEHGLFPKLYSLMKNYEEYKVQIFDAVNNNDCDTVCALAKVCTLMIQDENGDTPLHHAVRKQNIPMLGVILVCNKNLICSKNKQGHTPIHLAVNGKLLLLRKLLLPTAYEAPQ